MGSGSSQIKEGPAPVETVTFENKFPVDILIEILSFVPAKDLLENCVVVCKDWKNIIEGQALWKQKCIRKGKTIPAWTFDKIPQHYYRKIFFHNPFGRNLLYNPCGEKEYDGYSVTSGGDGWAIEDPPKGADPVPKEVGTTSCFATSYSICSADQTINFTWDLEIPTVILDKMKPDILVGEWDAQDRTGLLKGCLSRIFGGHKSYCRGRQPSLSLGTARIKKNPRQQKLQYAARFDCGSEYHFLVELLDRLGNVVDKFEFEHTQEQWTGKAWHHVTHTFRNYPAGVRSIAFQHTGCDTQFWAGQYGSKMTGGYIKLLNP